MHKQRRRHHRRKRRRRNYLQYLLPSIAIILFVVTFAVVLKIFVWDRRAKPNRPVVTASQPQDKSRPKEYAAMDAEIYAHSGRASEEPTNMPEAPFLDPSEVVKSYSNRVSAAGKQSLSSSDVDRVDNEKPGRTNRANDLIFDPSAVIRNLTNRPNAFTARPDTNGNATAANRPSDSTKTIEPVSGSREKSSAPSAREKKMEARAQFARAQRLYSAGDMITAESICRQLQRDGQSMPEVNNMLGEIYTRQQKLDKALSEFMEAAQADPSNAEYFNNMGLVYSQLGKNDLAEKYLLQANKLDPINGVVLANCAWLYRKTTRYAEALKYLDLALVIEPNNSALRKKRIQTMIDLQEYDKAEVAAKQELQARPADLTAHLAIACVRSRQGDINGALEWFRKAERLTGRDVLRRMLEGVHDFDDIKENPQYKEYLASLKSGS
jgi:tetratricopeptide (TPR) repeat protein